MTIKENIAKMNKIMELIEDTTDYACNIRKNMGGSYNHVLRIGLDRNGGCKHAIELDGMNSFTFFDGNSVSYEGKELNYVDNAKRIAIFIDDNLILILIKK